MSRGRIAVVLNATSGHGAASKAAERLKEIFAEAGREARITLATGGSEINAAMRRGVEAGCETNWTRQLKSCSRASCARWMWGK